ncbi:PP2C family serine/threonine-protein phosphatase [Nocardia terpenica]|uniref:PP2C family serine/threonine-protein phosphatase n=1 Tax=Nocardia terpenica TaxID=455432 RepID=UPI00030F4DC8|nr:PP2C family serine/threonine-protein phosphatase [Nocardia terpenica]NQE89302.1 protein phosphatase 2C family protein [Nocardia terpenica]
MKIATAQLQERTADDRVLADDNGVVVLDGATAFDPDVPSAGTYVDVLQNELYQRLASPSDLRSILADAIRATADYLRILPGRAPSSTVAILRPHGDELEILVLGDTSVVIGQADKIVDLIIDDRIGALDLPDSQEYKRRLKSGTGYDQAHGDLLQSLQRQQRQRRNRPGGYWIAEADPSAAEHAVVQRYAFSDVDWVILATDGAAKPLEPLNISWPEVAHFTATGLEQLLDRCHRWEAERDPDGRLQPRAKRHDDKTIAVVRPNCPHHAS